LNPHSLHLSVAAPRLRPGCGVELKSGVTLRGGGNRVHGSPACAPQVPQTG